MEGFKDFNDWFLSNKFKIEANVTNILANLAIDREILNITNNLAKRYPYFKIKYDPFIDKPISYTIYTYKVFQESAGEDVAELSNYISDLNIDINKLLYHIINELAKKFASEYNCVFSDPSSSINPDGSYSIKINIEYL